MCGGGSGGSREAERQQALSSRVRQAEYDMISRINRGLDVRRLLTPEEIAARRVAEDSQSNNRHFNNNNTIGYHSTVSIESLKEDPTYEY